MSAPVIIQRTISGSPETAIQVGNGQFGRLVTLPPAWSKIRVGVRWHTTDSGAAIVSTPRWALGLGNGTSNMVGDASCTNFIGIYSNDATVTRGVTFYVWDINTIVPMKKVGATITTGTAVNTVNALDIRAGAASGTADRTCCFVDITKGSPNYTLNCFAASNGAAADVSEATFLNQIILATPVISNHSMNSDQTLAFSEAAGTLNAVQFFWDRTEALFEICDLAVALLA